MVFWLYYVYTGLKLLETIPHYLLSICFITNCTVLNRHSNIFSFSFDFWWQLNNTIFIINGINNKYHLFFVFFKTKNFTGSFYFHNYCDFSSYAEFNFFPMYMYLKITMKPTMQVSLPNFFKGRNYDVCYINFNLNCQEAQKDHKLSSKHKRASNFACFLEFMALKKYALLNH